MRRARPALTALAAALGGWAVAGAAWAVQCPFDGETVIAAAGQLGGVNSADRVAAQPAPAPPAADDEDAPAPRPAPPPAAAPGACEVLGASVIATARSEALECKATLMGRIRTQPPWKLAKIEVDGSSFVFVSKPPRGARNLDTVLKVSAPARKTRAATLMRVTFDNGQGEGACPRLDDILEQH